MSQNRELTGLSATIAWRLIWFGTWADVGQEVHREGDRLLWVDHLICPQEWDEHPPAPDEPRSIGALSQMISAAYLRGAARTIHTVAKDGVLEPGYMGDFIPENFTELGLDIPLTLLRIEPNLDLHESDDGTHSV